eukprot:jgi/Mesen1/8182/ME000044S07454
MSPSTPWMEIRPSRNTPPDEACSKRLREGDTRKKAVAASGLKKSPPLTIKVRIPDRRPPRALVHPHVLQVPQDGLRQVDGARPGLGGHDDHGTVDDVARVLAQQRGEQEVCVRPQDGLRAHGVANAVTDGTLVLHLDGHLDELNDPAAFHHGGVVLGTFRKSGRFTCQSLQLAT